MKPHTSIPRTATVRTLALAASLTLGSALLSACGSSSDSGEPATITVGVGGNIFDTPLRVAEAKGYFSKRGLKITYSTLTSSTGVSALQSGSVQFLTTSPNGFLSAVDKKLPITAISAVGLGNPLGLIVSNQYAQAHGLTAKTPAPQVAKTLAQSTPGYSSPNTKAEAGIFLKAHGVDPDKLKWVSLPSPAADQAALKNHQIDWFITSEPIPLQMQDTGDGVVVADPLTVPQWSAKAAGYGLFTAVRKSYAEDNPGVAKKFVAAVQDATNYMSTHPGDATVVAAAQKTLTNVPTSVVKDSLEQVEWPRSGKMTTAQWRTTIAFLNSLGTIKGGAKISSSDWTNEYLS